MEEVSGKSRPDSDMKCIPNWKGLTVSYRGAGRHFLKTAQGSWWHLSVQTVTYTHLPKKGTL